MQAERWKSVEELYGAAMALPPEKRADFLDQACPDMQLRGEVQSLLDQQTAEFLEDSPLSLNLKKGVRLGSFEMVERIGKRRHGRGVAGEGHAPSIATWRSSCCPELLRAIPSASPASSTKPARPAR